MSIEIWQTTNQQPWVEALAAGLITCKTRTSEPCVPLGAVVLLHASKSRLWPHWQGLKWTKGMNPKKWNRGDIVAVARVKLIGRTKELMGEQERNFWDVWVGEGHYNATAEWMIRFVDIRRLNVPVAAKGFQAPFARAKQETIEKVLRANPQLKSYFGMSIRKFDAMLKDWNKMEKQTFPLTRVPSGRVSLR